MSHLDSQVSSPSRPTLRERFRNSWWCERVEVVPPLWRGNVLNTARRQDVRARVAMVALGFFVLSQCVLPAAWTLSQVNAAEARQSQSLALQKQAQADKAAREEQALPRWAKDVRAQVRREKDARARRLAGAERQNPMVLAQMPTGGASPVRRVEKANVSPPLIEVPGSKPGQVAPSQDNGACEDCEVDVRALDLSKVPTEKQLRRAGQLGGALSPLRPAEPLEVEGRLDAILKHSGIKDGLRADLPESDPNDAERDRAGKLLKKARKKAKRAKEINQSFGEAIQEWNKHNYSRAAKMFEKHVKDYPESPWNGEAVLHLGCDAKYNGRFDEAQEKYDSLLKNTSDKKPAKDAESGRPMRTRSAVEAQRRLSVQVERILEKSATPEDAVDNVDDQIDLSFEIHQKAKLRWADLNLAMGRFDEASRKLADILSTDTDWRRLTWAQHWLRTANFYKHNAPQLMACGPQALGVVLAALHQKEAASRVVLAVAPRATGFNLAELQTLAAKNGAAMHGFKTSASELDKLPLPAILHYDWGGAASGAKDKSPFRLAGGTGHFVVLHEVNTRSKTVQLFDPIEKRFYSLSFAQLNRQWSGQGLALDGGKTRLASAQLDRASMEKAVGGCCGVPSKEDDLGDSPNNEPCIPCGDSDKGEPVVEINRATMNMYVHDTPLWYEPAKGPSVGVSISYNSQDATTQNTPFGNKWMFNYGTYLVEDTALGGGRVTVFMPDGSKDNYTPDGAGGYRNEIGNFSRLQKSSATNYSITFQDGTRWVYDIPRGTTSLQVFLREVVDPLGFKLQFGYDQNVRLTTITDADGGVTTINYNAAGKAATVWEPSGRHAAFSYDAQGNLIECVDMEGQAFQYTYDSKVRITRLNTALGPWVFTHEGPDGSSAPYYPAPGAPMWANIRLTVANPAGAKEEYYYDGYYGRSWHIAHNDYRGYPGNGEPRYGAAPNRTEYRFTVVGGKGRISQIAYPDGTSVSMGYDTALDAVNTVTDARGKISRVSYNAQGRPLSTTDPKGNVSTLSYAPNGLDVTSIQNANGQVVASYAYNALRQVVSATDRGGTTTYSYTPWGDIAGSVDPQNRASQYQYNAQDRLALVLFADAPVGGVRDWQSLSGFTYDAAGRVKTQTDEAGLTLAYEYNNLDGVTKVSYPDGTSSEVDYVVSNLPGVVKDRSGRRSYYDYDPMKRLSRVQDAQGNTLQMDYDPSGNMTRLLDAKGNQTKWAYDARNRVTAKAYHDGTTEAFAYAGGLLSQTKGARGQIIRYSYDDNANVSLVDYPNQADVSFAYNKLDDVTQVVDGIGTHSFAYDNFGRLDALDGPFANDGQNFAYDALGRLQSQRVQKGAGAGTQSQSYAFDALERLTSLTSNAGTFNYSYVGNTDLLASLDLPNGSKVEQGYDALQRLTSVVNRTGTTNLARYTYGYDTRNVRTGMQSQLATDPLKQINYAYDAVDQLTGEQASGGAANTAYTNAFQYDAMGNRTRHENTRIGAGGVSQSSVARHTPNALNQLTALSTQTGAGARQTTGFSYDVSGNMTEQTGADGSKTLYSYDDADRLKHRVALFDGNTAEEERVPL